MSPTLKTTATAKRLGVPYHRLFSLLRYGVVPTPQQRDSSGHYLWSDADVEAARRAIEARDAKKNRMAVA